MSADPYGVAGGFDAPGPVTEETLWCPECGERWEARFYMEAGTNWPYSEDEECSECGAEGEL